MQEEEVILDDIIGENQEDQDIFQEMLGQYHEEGVNQVKKEGIDHEVQKEGIEHE